MFSSTKLLSVLALAFSASALPLVSRDTPGITLTNKGKSAQQFYFYNNKVNGNGWADPNFDSPLPNAPTLKPGETKFIPLDVNFKGRVQRGNHPLWSTWVEFQLKDNSWPHYDGKAHGDVSLQQGCDGPATITSPTTKKVGGFVKDVISGAPEAALAKNADGTLYKTPGGSRALASPVGNWEQKFENHDVVNWLAGLIAKEKTYFLNGVAGASGVEDVASDTNQLIVDFY